MEHIDQRSCGASSCGDIQNVTGQATGNLLSVTLFGQELDQMSFRGVHQPPL